MLRRSVAASVLILALAACGGSSGVQAQGPTAASVSVQSSDVPSGLTKCDLTGDINSFITKEQSPDPSTSQSTKTEWDDARKNGATAAYVAVYADSSSHCSDLKSSQTVIGSAQYRLVVNFVIQFKDSTSAAAAYTGNQKFMNFSPSDLRSTGLATAEGTKTGLTANSIVLDDQPVPNQHFYIAVWQNKAFMVILAILNVDSTASKKVALAENGRIK
jgi:hypothetical protein